MKPIFRYVANRRARESTDARDAWNWKARALYAGQSIIPQEQVDGSVKWVRF